MIRPSLFLLLALALTALSTAPSGAGWYQRTVEGNGDLVTTKYDLESCDSISLRCGLDIHVGLGEKQQVLLSMDKNLVDLYEIEARRGVLVIDADDNPRPDAKARLDVTLVALSRLAVSGAGDVEIASFEGEKLELVVDGAGDLEVHGRVGRVEIGLNGAGDIDARDLKADEAVVTVNGAGDVRVHASASADVTINGVGDVDVYGDPEHFARVIHGIGDVDRK